MTLYMASLHVYCLFYLQQTLTLTSTDQTVCHSEHVREANEASAGTIYEVSWFHAPCF